MQWIMRKQWNKWPPSNTFERAHAAAREAFEEHLFDCQNALWIFEPAPHLWTRPKSSCPSLPQSRFDGGIGSKPAG